MQAIVVYESHWGNTKAVADAIAEGLGPGARAVTTTQATPELLEVADLIVAGAPVLGFSLPSDRMVESLSAQGDAPSPPDISSVPLRTWLSGLPRGHGAHAAFETRIRWSPGGATGSIDRGLEATGYRRISAPQKFVVKGKYGPLREGELERARAWGTQMAAAMRP
jgi:hypothetical protein